MEVHAHTHPASGGTRKKWTHYFWEFLMLFLAVFCGFLAEYQLEHKIEKDREKKYIASMVDDLKRDTANFKFVIARGRETMFSIDTLISLLGSADRESKTSAMYYYARKTTITSFPFEIFDRTYSQMKSSGNLRLLHRQAIADSITSYYYDVNFLSSQQDFVNKLLMEYIKNVSVVFDASVFHKMYKDAGLSENYALKTKSFIIPDAPKDNPPLADNSKNAIHALVGSMHYMYGRLVRVNGIAIGENEKALRLIQLLEKKYHLK